MTLLPIFAGILELPLTAQETHIVDVDFIAVAELTHFEHAPNL